MRATVVTSMNAQAQYRSNRGSDYEEFKEYQVTLGLEAEKDAPCQGCRVRDS